MDINQQPQRIVITALKQELEAMAQKMVEMQQKIQLCEAATNNANTQAQYAQQQGDYANATMGTHNADPAAHEPIRTALQQYTNTRIAQLVNGSPAALDTLAELAAALGNDPNFATTMINTLAGKSNTNHTHDYNSLSNKPTIGNATISIIDANGTTKTFTTNQASNATLDFRTSTGGGSTGGGSTGGGSTGGGVGGGVGGCFLAGTQVLMADGTLKNIENIDTGELVVVWNSETNTIGTSSVRAWFKHQLHEDMLTIDGVGITLYHKIRTGNEWRRADEFSITTPIFLLSEDGKELVEDTLQNIARTAASEVIVYNIEVNTYHNYFVALPEHRTAVGGGGDCSYTTPKMEKLSSKNNVSEEPEGGREDNLIMTRVMLVANMSSRMLRMIFDSSNDENEKI